MKQTGHLDLRSVVDSAEEVMELLSFGNQMRTVAATRSETTPREQLGSLMAQKHWLDSGQLCAQATTMRGSKFHELTSPRYMMSPFPVFQLFSFDRLRNSRSSRSHAFFNFKPGPRIPSSL